MPPYLLLGIMRRRSIHGICSHRLIPLEKYQCYSLLITEAAVKDEPEEPKSKASEAAQGAAVGVTHGNDGADANKGAARDGKTDGSQAVGGQNGPAVATDEQVGSTAESTQKPFGSVPMRQIN